MPLARFESWALLPRGDALVRVRPHGALWATGLSDALRAQLSAAGVDVLAPFQDTKKILRRSPPPQCSPHKVRAQTGQGLCMSSSVNSDFQKVEFPMAG